MPVIYENSFNSNEIFVVIFLAIGIILLWIFRRRFSTRELLVYTLYAITVGTFFDHAIAAAPIDFYDVNDSSYHEFMDTLTYIMYGPYGYLFIYFYDYFKIKLSHAPIYILFWVSVSIGIEVFGDYIGVFHYKNGYKILYSFPIYLFTHSVYICFYKYINKSKMES